LAQLRLPGTITLVQNELASIEQASDTLSLLFQIVTVVVLIIAFFSLNSSMFTNIMEQKMEIGILRALGVRKLAIFRLYTYEAFFLIFAASLLGVNFFV
jgi:ABC-type antimicrobial peptide transport system permease subunit